MSTSTIRRVLSLPPDTMRQAWLPAALFQPPCEVRMSGRRSYVRFAVLQPPEGMLRVLQDVVIQNTGDDHTIALSRDPGVLGEVVSVQCPHSSDSNVWAKVLDSQPVVVDGNVRHQLRLHHLGENQ